MDKKIKTIIVICVIVVIIILMVVLKNKKNSKNTSQVDGEVSTTTTTYNEEESLYKVVDKETGEILYEGTSEADAYLYQIDPNYESSNPDVVDEYSLEEEF